MFIQTPTLQGSRAENLKVKIKGDWEGKESKEGKLNWVHNYFWIIISKKPKQIRTHSLLLEDSDFPDILREEIEDKEFLKILWDFSA